MKNARTRDKETQQVTGIIRAAAVTEATRYAQIYECPETGCECRVHWRRAVRGEENTVFVAAPTFVKNPSSSHREGCHRDYERIARENHEYVSFKDGKFQARILFPLGAAKPDLLPAAGWLRDEQIKAAHNRTDIKPFGTLKELAAFVEKAFGSLESDLTEDLVLYYQGRSLSWDKVFIPSTGYDELYRRGLKEYSNGMRQAAFTVVKPHHEIDRSGKRGLRRFACEEQYVKIDGKIQRIQPVAVLDETGSSSLFNKVVEAAKNEKPLLIAARPYVPHEIRYGRAQVSLLIKEDGQLTNVKDHYWRWTPGPIRQMDLFPQKDTPKTTPPSLTR